MLLDTHIVLAVLGQTELSLKDNVADLLRQQSDVFVSVASIWEIAIKHRSGKLALSIDVNNLSGVLKDIDITILDIVSAHTTAEIGQEPVTKDPFDRLLLGVCESERKRLLTIDKALVDHPLAWRWD